VLTGYPRECQGSNGRPGERRGRFVARSDGDTRDIEAQPPTEFADVAGEVLRQVRLGRGLSLRQVTVRSGGRFKPSSVASYERGERQISLERFFALSDVYDVAPERIVAAIAHQLEVAQEGPREGRAASARPDRVEVLEPFVPAGRNRR
jgi:transcriptional regulator with XRE-family HTH domain